MNTARKKRAKRHHDERIRLKARKINLINQAKEQLSARKENPTATAIKEEIAQMAEKNPSIQKLSFSQIYNLGEEGKITLPERKIDKKRLLSHIKTIVGNLKKQRRKATRQRVVDELNKSEDSLRWNYDNFWHYLKAHKIKPESLGIVSERSGHLTFLEDVIRAAKEIAAEIKSNKIPLSQLRKELNLQPSAFSNRVIRLKRTKGIILSVELAAHNLYIVIATKIEEKKPQEKLAVITISAEQIPGKIEEIENWLEELGMLNVDKNTDIDNQEMVLLVREIFKELIQACPNFLKKNLDGQITEQSQVIRELGERIHNIIKQKREEITELKIQEREKVARLEKQTRTKRKQLNRQLGLKHFEGSLADKLFALVAEQNVELVEVVVARIWKRKMKTPKEIEALITAREFLTKKGINTS